MDSTGATMMSCAHLFVHIYSRLVDGEHVVAMTLHSSGTGAQIHVYNREGASATCDITESNMLMLKNGCNPRLTWLNFFELLQRAFIDHTIEFENSEVKITVKHDQLTTAIPIEPFTICLAIHVPPLTQRVNDMYKFAASMISYVSLRNDGHEMDRLDKIAKYEGIVKDVVIRARSEVALLEAENKSIHKLQLHADILGEENKRLAGDKANYLINELAASATADPHNIDCVISRVADPLYNKQPCKSYHTKMMQYIKGRSGVAVNDQLTALSKECMNYLFHQSSDGTFPFPDLECPSGPFGVAARSNDAIDVLSRYTLDRLSDELEKDPLTREVMRMVKGIDEWDFDIFLFDTTCRAISPDGSNSPNAAGAFFYVAYAVITGLDLMTKFNISEKAMLQWLSMVEEGYNNYLPFHNALHAADVLQGVYYMLVPAEGITRLGITNIDQLAIVLASLIHDFGHPGTTNQHLVDSHSSIALCYGGESPLEQMHFASVMELMKLQRYNLFKMIECDVRKEIEDRMGYLVLSTDLYRHDTIVGALRLRMQEWGLTTHWEDDPICHNNNDALLILSCFLKAADISNYTRNEDLYKNWATRLEKELQTSEKGQGELLPVSYFIGGNITLYASMAKLQIVFISSVVVPLFSEIVELLPKLRFTGNNVAKNRNRWANGEDTKI
eukprot:Tbor_TRINITY_DN2565_c0_g1::TRINITY_DN2565_c0_g1_i1::g.548::m.548/K13755/PDE1; calcium/calmodulin-dependent 3',5'-cyclic nucleotide phosphodiesterase